tara:strand:- start:494 stop:763 length:270 start_codon:yes stop_codon:yes gene_type:complete
MSLSDPSAYPDEIEDGEILDTESEIEMETDSIIDPGDDEEIDLPELLGSLFATEEGDTVCTALVGISNQIQIHNKILIKILAQLQSLKK